MLIPAWRMETLVNHGEWGFSSGKESRSAGVYNLFTQSRRRRSKGTGLNFFYFLHCAMI